MYRFSFLRAVTLVVMVAGGALQAAPPVPPLSPALAKLAPTAVLPRELEAAMRFRDLHAASAPSSASWEADSAGSRVLRISTTAVRSNASEVNISWLSAAPLRRGDVCLARFQVRTRHARQESGESLFNFQVQPTPSGERSLILPIAVGPDWTLVEIPFAVVAAAPPAGMLVQFSFGLLPQTVEIASVELWNFGDRTTVGALPLTRFTYAGRDRDAAWRKEALARIEQIRTGPLKVRVTDRAGQPVRGAPSSGSKPTDYGCAATPSCGPVGSSRRETSSAAPIARRPFPA